MVFSELLLLDAGLVVPALIDQIPLGIPSLAAENHE